MSHESDNFETEPKPAYEHLQDAGLIGDAGEIDKDRFISAARQWTDEREAPYEAWADEELLQMVIAMDPRDPEEFELQQKLWAIWKKRVKARHEEL